MHGGCTGGRGRGVGGGGRVGPGNVTHPAARVPECPRMPQKAPERTDIPRIPRKCKTNPNAKRGTRFQRGRVGAGPPHGSKTRATASSPHARECSTMFSFVQRIRKAQDEPTEHLRSQNKLNM